MKKILILGGTGFVGRILTENLLKTDNSVTLFNRGKRNPDIFPGVRKFIGDRDTDDILQIGNESWDSVIDFSCMFPDNLDKVTELLKGKAGRYIFVSTASVYPMDDPGFWKLPMAESAPTLPCTTEQRKDKNVMATYGQKKAECERVLLSKEWLDVIIFRPGLIYGRYDPTDRFYYWLYKVKKQDKVLVPEDSSDKFTNTYSEDFTSLIKSAIDTVKHNKIYNAETHAAVSLKELLDISCRLFERKPEFINASAKFLETNSVQPWADLPVWLGGMNLVLDYSKALKDFPVSFHSFEDSVKGCIEYYSSLNWTVPKYGLSAEKEQELINSLTD
jgi:2'-hydroxyisoflavone reductase